MKNKDQVYFETDTGRFAEATVKQLNRLQNVPMGTATIIATIAAIILDNVSDNLALNLVQDNPMLKFVLCCALAGSIDLIPSIAADIVYKEKIFETVKTDWKAALRKAWPLLVLGFVFLVSLISALIISLDRLSMMSMFSAYEDVSEASAESFSSGQVMIAMLRGIVPLMTTVVIFMVRRAEILENPERIKAFCKQKLAETENLKNSAEVEIFELEKDAKIDRKKYMLNDLNAICAAANKNAALTSLDAAALIAKKINTPDMYSALEQFNTKMLNNSTASYIRLPDLNARIESELVNPILNQRQETEEGNGDITVSPHNVSEPL